MSGQKSRTQLGWFAVLSVLAVCPSAAQAQLQTNEYAVFYIRNATTINVTYQYRWGTNASWQSNTLQPGKTWFHWWTFKLINVNNAPVPQVKFAAGIGTPRGTTT